MRPEDPLYAVTTPPVSETPKKKVAKPRSQRVPRKPPPPPLWSPLQADSDIQKQQFERKTNQKNTKRNKKMEKFRPYPLGAGLSAIREWFFRRGQEPFDYQEEAWAQYRDGNSGIINVPTGAGKTYAAYLGPLSELMENPPADTVKQPAGLCILIVTPLRALSRDMEKALLAPILDLNLPFRVESRTGDTSGTIRARQKKNLPHILITTPESLNLLLSYEDAKERFSALQSVIIDEWHELLSSKRGIQMELALARIRRFSPTVRTWALSATIANLHEAARCAIGVQGIPVIVSGQVERLVTIDSLIPEKIESLPWAGHLGSTMLEPLLTQLDINISTLIFTNVRSHAERWYQDILAARPEWAGLMALHHGSLDRREREFVEAGLKDGYIKLAICTSSLDLGVDFSPVERVFQIGSPKGIARMIQRAGRSSHRPGLPCRITCVPTQALELPEVAAVRQAIRENRVEPRLSIDKPYDVLMQHLVTCALGGGFDPERLYREITQAFSYRNLTEEEFSWVLALVRDGGKTLSAYPEYRKIELQQGFYHVPDQRIARLHRFNIGTISSDSSMSVALLQGKRLGTVEESFVSRLKKGDIFTFAGRTVEFAMVREMTAYVRLAKKKTNVIPRWSGGRLPLSASLADELRRTLERNIVSGESEPELKALTPILALQREISLIPKASQLLVELLRTRQGYHLFLYPFEGRLVHEGLAALLGFRMGREARLTFQVTVNDYGIEFLSQDDFPFEELLANPALFAVENLTEDMLASLNMSELARRQFRDVARIAGLIYQNYPGAHKSARQLNTSSSVLYDVFERFDPENLLLQQARREVLERQFEQDRLTATLQRLSNSERALVHLKRPSPLGFPLMAERVGSQFNLSNESLAERIAKMQKQWLK